MLARSNLPAILERTRHAERVLDVGGAYSPLNTATHVIDCLPLERASDPLVKGENIRFDASRWLVADICDRPWPYPDGYFDFVFCSHVLEDVRDPVGVCREMARVGRAGYIETPSRLVEALHAKRGYLWRRIVGRPLRIGYGHHRWFVEAEDGALVFTAKTMTTSSSPAHFITSRELRRPLTETDRALSLFWTGALPATERLLIEPGETEADLIAFKRRALARA
jgi:hypothetical protein